MRAACRAWPAVRQDWNLMPFTSQPWLCSSMGMTRVASGMSDEDRRCSDVVHDAAHDLPVRVVVHNPVQVGSADLDSVEDLVQADAGVGLREDAVGLMADLQCVLAADPSVP